MNNLNILLIHWCRKTIIFILLSNEKISKCSEILAKPIKMSLLVRVT